MSWPLFFEDKEGIFMTDYLLNSQTDKAKYYCNLQQKGVLFLQNNALAHKMLDVLKCYNFTHRKQNSLSLSLSTLSAHGI